MTKQEANQLSSRLKQTWGGDPKIRLCRIPQSILFTWCPTLKLNLAPNIQFECFPFGGLRIPACTLSVWHKEEFEDGEELASWEPVLHCYYERLNFLSWESHEGAMGEAAKQWSEEFQRKSWMCGFLIETNTEQKNEWLELLITLK